MKVVLAALAFFLFFFLPQSASAHLGNGPPFMKVNGKYSQTNPYNQGSSTLTMSWDSAPDTYLVNKPITFAVDVPVLMTATTVPLSFAKNIQIRWSVATGDNFEKKEEKFESGTEFTRTFTKPGSYLVIAEAKLPADSDYILINTVQVDILPNSGYHTPAPSAYVGTQYDDPKKNILLVSDTITDPSVTIKKYLWDFGDGQLHQGATIDRKFERAATMGTETIFHRVIDENGFIADLGFVADKIGDKLRFEPFAPGKPLPIVVVTYDEAAAHANKTPSPKLSLPMFLGLVVGVLVFTGGGWWWVLRANHESRITKHDKKKQNRDS